MASPATNKLRRSAVQTLQAAANTLTRPLRAIRCARCDHPFSSDEGQIDDESSSSSLGLVSEEQVCTRCQRARLVTLGLLFAAFAGAGLAVMLLAPG